MFNPAAIKKKKKEDSKSGMFDKYMTKTAMEEMAPKEKTEISEKKETYAENKPKKDAGLEIEIMLQSAKKKK